MRCTQKMITLVLLHSQTARGSRLGLPTDAVRLMRVVPSLFAVVVVAVACMGIAVTSGCCRSDDGCKRGACDTCSCDAEQPSQPCIDADAAQHAMRRFQQTFKILKEWHDLSGNSAKDNAVWPVAGRIIRISIHRLAGGKKVPRLLPLQHSYFRNTGGRFFLSPKGALKKCNFPASKYSRYSLSYFRFTA